MYRHHHPAPTTRTVELQQVQEINRRLASPGHPDVTAAALGVAGAVTTGSPFPDDPFGPDHPSAPALRPTAHLRYLTAEGSPEFPYVLGHFSTTPVVGRDRADLVVELHSAGLRRLSARLGLRQCWGTDAPLAGAVVRQPVRAAGIRRR